MGSCVSITVETGPCAPISESNGNENGRGNGNEKRRQRRRRTQLQRQPQPHSSSVHRGCSSSSAAFDYRVDEDSLHRIPGRIFLNGSTRIASLYCKQGRKGQNQDAMLLWENVCSKEDTVFCGVFDGHGPHGHRIAKKVRDSFPLILMAEWDLHLHNNKDGLCSSSAAVEKPNLESHDTNALEAVRESYVKACKLMDKEINMQNNFDCYCSGTTAVTVVKQGQHLVIGNVGDSRAVLCTRDHDDSLVPVQLTTDFKPSLPREAERIKLSKGRVFGLPNEPEVARVWLPNIDSPGLAMSRAFGDFCLKDFGLISLPDVSYHHISDKDEFVVLATDGIWDVLSNREVLGIVGSVPRSCAARIVVDSAVHAWRTKFPAAKIDDCSVVCLFFDSDSDQGKSPSSAEDMMMMMDEQSEVGTVLSATNTIVGPMQPLKSRTNTTSK
ncbi:probable protein phosphatase 2C 33 [Arachis stenosperma]|uniref:probable protein phosphatase 2C 33 n=1 Tax=Arachis stenosperma TaxID=217475 RepID=UPI0025ABB3A8|nr:probable protein phosphatase 2C 33 [Arachis stenosperma]